MKMQCNFLNGIRETYRPPDLILYESTVHLLVRLYYHTTNSIERILFLFDLLYYAFVDTTVIKPCFAPFHSPTDRDIYMYGFFVFQWTCKGRLPSPCYRGLLACLLFSTGCLSSQLFDHYVNTSYPDHLATEWLLDQNWFNSSSLTSFLMFMSLTEVSISEFFNDSSFTSLSLFVSLIEFLFPVVRFSHSECQHRRIHHLYNSPMIMCYWQTLVWRKLSPLKGEIGIYML